MYRLRRVYKPKPGQTQNVAKLVYKQSKLLQDAGHRGEFTVCYNGATLPGETNIVILEWQDDVLMSPRRPGNDIPPEVVAIQREYPALIESQHIEFYEILDPSQISD